MPQLQDCIAAMKSIEQGAPVGSQSCQEGEPVVAASAKSCQIVIKALGPVADCRLSGSDVIDVARAIMASYPAGELTGGIAATTPADPSAVIFTVDVNKVPPGDPRSLILVFISYVQSPFSSACVVHNRCTR